MHSIHYCDIMYYYYHLLLFAGKGKPILPLDSAIKTTFSFLPWVMATLIDRTNVQFVLSF